ncbi:MAG: tetratricopeptide repeat protein [Acidobacteria bacterium]|nr:tetratricopeptide repeat protein [Acidobacteriota bacterium]MBI3663913.1 tetratricopeptide repeat protein [Acidobacteriota bacterium]
MAFNKAKHLESAQKFLSQGKLAQAISEYEQILKNEPEDQVTLMTVGDLHVRSGDIHKALEYFEQLAHVFLGDGFNSKAIAIYKKIAKLAPEETKPLEKLAELYVAQGVMSEARSLYLQLAETHLRSGRTEKAVGVLRQLLDLEPDNLRVQLRLAELYTGIGQGREAAHAYLNCAHRMLDHGHFSEALKFADQALKADPANARAISVKARALAATGKVPEAITLLESAPDAAAGADTTQLLVEFYLQARQANRAVEFARKVFTAAPDRFSVVYDLAVNLLDSGEPDRALELIGEIREPMLAAADYDRLTQALNNLAERLSGRLEPLEWLVDAYRRSSDSFRIKDGLDQLAEALVSSGQLERAREIFEELVEREPDDENNRRRLDQVRARLGLPALEEAAPTPPPQQPAEAPPPAPAPEMVETVVSATPPEEGQFDDETQIYIHQSLTDVDLFSSYGLAQKAIDLLEKVLQRAPQHTTVLEKLLDLHLGAGNDRRTAELASQLEQVYIGRGDSSRAERFAELGRRFQRAARLTAEEAPPSPPPAAEFSIPTAPVEAIPEASAEPVQEVEARPEGEAAVHEVDLSEEWAALSQLTSEPAAQPAPPPAAEEVPPEEITLFLDETPAAAPEAAPEVSVEAAAEPAVAAEATAEVFDYELEVAPAPPEPAPAPPPAQMTSDQLLKDLVAEVDELELGPAAPKEAAPPPSLRAAAPAPGSGESVEQLREVFNEFRQELGEMGAEEEVEDLETHYNLGIAYREMGLLEEAIGEFQKVAKAVQSGQSFRYAMQCFTLLGLSFMDKGQPNIAAMWYERALGTPGLDQESVLALRYDLGVAQELAGSIPAALDSFTQVYAMNIDYRDVAERIASLQKRR